MFPIPNGNGPPQGTTLTPPPQAPQSQSPVLSDLQRMYDVPDEPATFVPQTQQGPAANTGIATGFAEPPRVLNPAPAPQQREPITQQPQAQWPQQQQAPQQPPQGQHPAWLMARANAIGIHPLTIARTPTDELTQIVMERLSAPQQPQQVQQASQVPQQVQQAQQAQQQPQGPRYDWGEFVVEDENGNKVRRKIVDADIYEPVAVAFQKLYAEVEGIKAQMGGFVQAAQQATQRSIQQRFDDVFSLLPGVFGAGRGDALQGTPEFMRRVSIYNAVNAIPAEQRQGVSLEQCVAYMTKMMFGIDMPLSAQPQAPQPRPVGRQLQEAIPPQNQPNNWVNAGLVQPTPRQPSSMPNGRNKAIQSVGEYLKQQDFNGDTQGDWTSMNEFFGGAG